MRVLVVVAEVVAREEEGISVEVLAMGMGGWGER